MHSADIYTYKLERGAGGNAASASPLLSVAPASPKFTLPLPPTPAGDGGEPAAGRPLPPLRWIAPHPLYARIYAAVAGAAGGEGSVWAVEVDPVSGAPVRTLGSGRSTAGKGPCHISVTDRFVLVAHYSGGSVSVLPILPDGSLGEVVCLRDHGPAGAGKHARQEAPHPHQIILSNDGRFAFVCDLGLNAVVVCASWMAPSAPSGAAFQRSPLGRVQTASTTSPASCSPASTCRWATRRGRATWPSTPAEATHLS
jgi:hypothetical protein